MLGPSQATSEVTCASLFFSYLLSLSISSVLNRLWHLHGCRVPRLQYKSTWSPVSTRLKEQSKYKRKAQVGKIEEDQDGIHHEIE